MLVTLLCTLAGCASSTPKGTAAAPEATAAQTEHPPAEVGSDEDATDKGEADDEDRADVEREFGKFVRIDLVTAKPDQAASFYQKLMGWNLIPIEGASTERFIIQNQGHELARIQTLDPTRPIPAGWMSWVSVEDIDDMLRDMPPTRQTQSQGQLEARLLAPEPRSAVPGNHPHRSSLAVRRESR